MSKSVALCFFSASAKTPDDGYKCGHGYSSHTHNSMEAVMIETSCRSDYVASAKKLES